MAKKYPQCEKYAEVRDKMVEIRNFMEFLSEKKMILAKYGEWPGGNDRILYEQHLDMEALLCEHFGIDPKKLEKERSAMLEVCRNG